MSARAETLAERFEQVNAELLEVVEPLDEADWFRTCPGERATVAAVVSHVGGSYRAIGSWVQAVANGEELPALTREAIDEGNRRHAERHARRPKEEALAALRANAAVAAAMVRALDDAQLDRTAHVPQFDRSMSAYQLVEEVLIGHPLNHLASIRATLASHA